MHSLDALALLDPTLCRRIYAPAADALRNKYPPALRGRGVRRRNGVAPRPARNYARRKVSALVEIERHQLSFSIVAVSPSAAALSAASATTNHKVSILPSRNRPV